MLGFSRALGEFGATIMIAGAIPGRTRTLAVGIYTLVETGREDAAWMPGADLRGAGLRRDLRLEPAGRPGRPRVIELSIDITLRQGAFVLSVRDAASVEVLGLFGPSGSGKTSLLEAIAGIRTPDAARSASASGRCSRRRGASICRRANAASATCRRMRCCFRT